MSYKPTEKSEHILTEALHWVQSVDYPVTARWVFYRLLQQGIYGTKAGYKHLLGLLSKARKEFYEEWRPYTLADDSRAPILMQRRGYYTIYMRGSGFTDGAEWEATLAKELNCPLDRWTKQPTYSELWFEAAAMQGQFLHYADSNMPLLAFHGDVSIPEKWRAAQRLADWWLKYRRPVHIYYYGDLDPKGLLIPKSAWEDIFTWALAIINHQEKGLAYHADLNFHRVGINEDQIEELGIPENPERPGTYQWEALDDNQARDLIELSQDKLDMAAFDDVMARETEIVKRFRAKLLTLQ